MVPWLQGDEICTQPCLAGKAGSLESLKKVCMYVCTHACMFHFMAALPMVDRPIELLKDANDSVINTFFLSLMAECALDTLER